MSSLAMNVTSRNLSRVVVLLLGAHWLGGCSESNVAPPAQFRALAMPDSRVEPGYVQRSRPKGLALSADETKLFVGQEGDLVNPAHQIRVLNTQTGQEITRITLGSAPQYVLLSPDGSKLYVTNRFSNYLSVVDTGTLTEVGKISVSYYSEKMALSRDGRSLYVTNRWLGAVEVVQLDAPNAASGKVSQTIKAWKNPRDLVVGPDDLIYVGNLGGTSVSMLDPVAGKEVDRLWTNSPINALAADANYVFVGTLGRGDGHPKANGTHQHNPTNAAYVCAVPGPDPNCIQDGNIAFKPTPVTYRGDTTAGVGFVDINNDLMVLTGNNATTKSMQQVFRYTSDTAQATQQDFPFYGCDRQGQNCTKPLDYAPDELIVVGAMPEQIAIRGSRLYVTMSASDQMVMYDIAQQAMNASAAEADRSKVLTRVKVAGVTGPSAAEQVCDTGKNPFGIVVTKDGNTVFTADRLSDTISKIDTTTCQRTEFALATATPTYPANEYEQGEMVFHSSKWSSEALPNPVYPTGAKAGDKTCNACHREAYTDGKLWTVGVSRGVVFLGGERLPPRASNIGDTDPLFWEGVQHPRDFDLEGNEFTLPTEFASCATVSELDGEQIGTVEDAAGDATVPTACAARDQFITSQFGPGYTFNTVARHFIGSFLTGRQRVLPNPDAQDPTPEQEAQITRGRQLFFTGESDGGASCFFCHPGGGTGNPFTANLNLQRVISESGLDNGKPVAKLTGSVKIDGRFNIPSIRYLFDRPMVLLHDGRAKSIKSAILGPDHPALVAGEDGCLNVGEGTDQFNQDPTRGVVGLPRPVFNGKGCNEVQEITQLPASEQLFGPQSLLPQFQATPLRNFDTHGTTSNLSPAQIDDLVAFVRSIEE